MLKNHQKDVKQKILHELSYGRRRRTGRETQESVMTEKEGVTPPFLFLYEVCCLCHTLNNFKTHT